MKPKAATKSANLYSRWSLPPSTFQAGRSDRAIAISVSVSFAGLDVVICSPRRKCNHCAAANFCRVISGGWEKIAGPVDRPHGGSSCQQEPAEGRFRTTSNWRIVMENVLTPNSQLGARSPSGTRASRKTGLWIGRVLTGLCAAFLLVDAAGKLLMLAPYVEGTRQLGYAIGVLRPLGVVL